MKENNEEKTGDFCDTKLRVSGFLNAAFSYFQIVRIPF